jgi:hypothetical protein
MKKRLQIFLVHWMWMATAALVFSVFLCLMTAFFSLSPYQFNLGKAFLDNLYFLLFQVAIGLPLAFLLSFFGEHGKGKRLFRIFLIGYLLFFLICIIIPLFQLNLSFSGLAACFQLSVWAMLAYTFFATPLIMMTLFFLVQKFKRN